MSSTVLCASFTLYFVFKWTGIKCSWIIKLNKLCVNHYPYFYVDSMGLKMKSLVPKQYTRRSHQSECQNPNGAPDIWMINPLPICLRVRKWCHNFRDYFESESLLHLGAMMKRNNSPITTETGVFVRKWYIMLNPAICEKNTKENPPSSEVCPPMR
jgi:hypothetical protein